MSNSPTSSTGSVSFRHEWRPPRSLCVCLIMLGVLAALALTASMIPKLLAWPAAMLALMHAAMLARRERRRPALDVCIHGSGVANVAGESLSHLQLDWRGPCAVFTWKARDGRLHRRIWTPENLPLSARRELRLAAGDFRASRKRQSMAP